MNKILDQIILFYFINCILIKAIKNEEKFQTSYVNMRDGIKLAVDYYLDNNSKEKYPVILEMTPYGRQDDTVNFRGEAGFWYKNGYVFVIADCRGVGDSEGEFELFAHEGEDGYDLIEWISKQPWSNGRVGMRGSSYSGTNQLFIAVKQPSSLKCITPNSVFGRPFENAPFEKGAFLMNWALNWIGKALKTKHKFTDFINNQTKWLNHRPIKTLDYFASGKELPLYRTFLEHVTLDSYWKKLIISEKEYSNSNIPSLCFTGWFDGAMEGTIWHFENFRKYSSNKNDRFIFIGPYVHTNAADGGYDFLTGEPIKELGDFEVQDNAFIPARNMTKDFYDWCLKNKTRPDWKNENIYITGTNKWLKGEYVLTNKKNESYIYLSSSGKANSLNGNGKLIFDIPEFEGKDVFTYNPNQPVRSDKKNVDDPTDMNYILDRTDVLVYTSDILKKPLTMIGDVEIELTISTTTKDTDFFAFLMDVYEDGRSIRIGSLVAPVSRIRYREGFEKEVFMEKNTKYNIKVSLKQIAHTFLTGHKIRLAITSSFFPWINANPNTGKPIETDTDEPIVSNQTIYYGNPKNKIYTRIKFMNLNTNSSSFILNQNYLVNTLFILIVFIKTNYWF